MSCSWLGVDHSADSMAWSHGLVPRRAVRFAMNGGMFDHQQAPVGLLVLSGEWQHQADTAKGQGNFHLLPNRSPRPRTLRWVEETGRFLGLAAIMKSH